MKMERVGEKRGGGNSRSIDISGIPQSVLERSVPSSGQLSPNGRLNLYHSPTSDKSSSSSSSSNTSTSSTTRAKSPASGMTNGRSSHHRPYSPTGSSTSVAGLPLTKNVGVGVNLTSQNRGSSSGSMNGKQGFATPQLPVGQLNGPRSGGGPPLSHSPTPTSQSGSTGTTSTILPELLQQGQTGKRGSGKSLVATATSLAQLTKGGTLSAAQRDLFNNINPNGNKIVNQNLNGTLAVTSVPTNDSELQLFRVLQRANLLNYFDVMIELGGDDVQQLCEAGEEEFLEIMALIGMATKPLHVRRLQKSLQDWMTQPSLFPGPILGPPLSAFTGQLGNQYDSLQSTANSPQLPIRPIPFHSGSSSSAPSFLSPSELKSLHMKFMALKSSTESSSNSNPNCNNTSSNSNSPINPLSIPALTSSTPHSSVIPIPFQSSSPTLPNGNLSNNLGSGFPHPFSYANGAVGVGPNLRIPADQIIPSQFLETRIRTRSEPNSPAESGSSSESPAPQLDTRTSHSPIPFLQDHEIEKIGNAAMKVIHNLPDYMNEPRVTAKRKTCADYETVLRISDDDPNRMDKVRKYAAIYGRYDCKRKVQKPLTIHELSVNEAASHLCNQVPALLTRRDELFLLARTVVRDAGLPYSSIISSTSLNMIIPLLKNAKHKNAATKIEDISNGSSSNDSNNSFGGKRPRLGGSTETEEFTVPRLTQETDTNHDQSLVPSKNAKLSSESHHSSFRDGSPETGRSASIFGPQSSVFSPHYDYDMPDDLSINNNRKESRYNSKSFKGHQVKSEPTSS